MEKLFYEFDVIYKGDDEDMLEGLGLPTSESFKIDKASFDINTVQSYYKSRKLGTTEFTSVTVVLTSSEVYTLTITYDEFKNLILSLGFKQVCYTPGNVSR